MKLGQIEDHQGNRGGPERMWQAKRGMTYKSEVVDVSLTEFRPLKMYEEEARENAEVEV